MKTTVELPDSLAQEARSIAQAQGTTLRALMLAGLRGELDRRTGPAPAKFRLHVIDGNGMRSDVDPAQLTELAYER